MKLMKSLLILSLFLAGALFAEVRAQEEPPRGFRKAGAPTSEECFNRLVECIEAGYDEVVCQIQFDYCMNDEIIVLTPLPRP